MMYFARNLFEQEMRWKQYQEMILCPLYLTSCELSIAHYNKNQIPVNGLKHNKCFPKKYIAFGLIEMLITTVYQERFA